MDTLHGVMRTLAPARKTETKPTDHVNVFREFISHLDKISRQAPKPSRSKAMRAKPSHNVKRKARR